MLNPYEKAIFVKMHNIKARRKIFITQEKKIDKKNTLDEYTPLSATLILRNSVKIIQCGRPVLFSFHKN